MIISGGDKLIKFTDRINKGIFRLNCTLYIVCIGFISSTIVAIAGYDNIESVPSNFRSLFDVSGKIFYFLNISFIFYFLYYIYTTAQNKINDTIGALFGKCLLIILAFIVTGSTLYMFLFSFITMKDALAAVDSEAKKHVPEISSDNSGIFSEQFFDSNLLFLFIVSLLLISFIVGTVAVFRRYGEYLWIPFDGQRTPFPVDIISEIKNRNKTLIRHLSLEYIFIYMFLYFLIFANISIYFIIFYFDDPIKNELSFHIFSLFSLLLCGTGITATQLSERSRKYKTVTWINSVRDDVALVISEIQKLSIAEHCPDISDNHEIEINSQHMREARLSLARIEMHLSPEDLAHQALALVLRVGLNVEVSSKLGATYINSCLYQNLYAENLLDKANLANTAIAIAQIVFRHERAKTQLFR
jgi:hypothetical protein